MTKFKPYQQEECTVQFKKSCHIKTSKKTVKQMMEVCRTPMVKVCPDEDDDVDKENEVCQTVYEPECWTKYEKHEVSISVIVWDIMMICSGGRRHSPVCYCQHDKV